MDGLTLIFLFGCGFLLVMIIAVAVAVTYSRRREGARAEDLLPKLAREMGLTRLDSRRPYHFGGTRGNHSFHLDLGVSGSVSARQVSLGKGIAVSVDVQMREPKQGYAYCNRGRVSSTTSFDTAFSAKLQYEWISAPAREAMLGFVRRREDLFLEGLPIHPPSASNPNPQVYLRHNLPANPSITRDEVFAVLDELITVAHVIETTC